MTGYRTLFALTATAFALAGCNSQVAAPPVTEEIKTVLGDPDRTPWDVGRDPLRKPAEVMAFAGIKPGMIVADLVPNDGYYTRMLAKLVGPTGEVYAFVPTGALGGSRDGRLNQREGKLPAQTPVDHGDECAIGCYGGTVAAHDIVPGSTPAYPLAVDYVLAIQNVDAFKNMTVYWEDIGAYGGDFGVPKQVDVVFTANGYHQLHFTKKAEAPQTVPGRGGGEFKPTDMIGANKAIFRAMKNGGTYLVLDYAAASGAGFAGSDDLHRVEAEAVKQEVLAAGFVFDGESKILANSSDDHKSPAMGKYDERDRVDQFILRFKKPMDAPNTDKRPTPEQEAEIMKNYYGNTFIGRADMTALDTKTGRRTRFHYYSPDHTYQEFGRLGEGPGPMQSGDWFWDADAHNCQLHQFPLDERASTVCHVDVQPDANIPFDVLSDGTYGAGPAKVTMKRGHIMQFPVDIQD